LAKFGTTVIANGLEVDTYDMVMIGLYETYSHADYNITAAPIESRQTAAEYLTVWIPLVYQGWMVDFASDPTSGIDSQKVSVKQSKLIVGLGNGWCGNKKSLLIMPQEAG
jgi:hypothetical protein